MSLLALHLALTGAAVGSFAALLTDRLPRNEPVVLGRSRCDVCGATLGWRDLVPILSYALLRGRARCCGAALRPRLLAAEIAGAAVGLAAAFAFQAAGSAPASG
jgi:leader peptidase (prepilin peptidase)/N-methyltransferase